MAEEYDALPKRNGSPDSRGMHELEFELDAGAPQDRPQWFIVRVSREDYDTLAEQSDTTKVNLAGLGAVPVIYNNGWEIAWDSLNGYSYGSP
jgi:hypothetical protein